MSDLTSTTKEVVESFIKSDQQSIHSTTALLNGSQSTSDKKPSQGFKGFLRKLREEDKERKFGRIEHISYDEANQRTGYDLNGWPNEEKQKEKDKEQGKGDRRSRKVKGVVSDPQG